LILREKDRRNAFRRQIQKGLRLKESKMNPINIDPVTSQPIDQDFENDHRFTQPMTDFDDEPLDMDLDYENFSDEIEMEDDHHEFDELVGIDDLENSIGVQSLYNDFDYLESATRDKHKFLNKLKNMYDDTILSNIDPEHFPQRPISQMDYDEIIAYHLKMYWETTEENLPRMHEQLMKWEEKIIPLIEDEQEHREFDINKYSHELIDKFRGDIGNEINLLQIVGNAENYELSRFLLVSLIMTNTENFDIVTSGNSLETPSLKLLKSNIQNDVIDREQQFLTSHP